MKRLTTLLTILVLLGILANSVYASVSFRLGIAVKCIYPGNPNNITFVFVSENQTDIDTTWTAEETTLGLSTHWDVEANGTIAHPLMTELASVPTGIWEIEVKDMDGNLLDSFTKGSEARNCIMPGTPTPTHTPTPTSTPTNTPQAPTCDNLALNPTSGNLPYNQSGTISYTDPDGHVESFRIQWGNEDPDYVGSEPSASHSVDQPGTFTAIAYLILNDGTEITSSGCQGTYAAEETNSQYTISKLCREDGRGEVVVTNYGPDAIVANGQIIPVGETISIWISEEKLTTEIEYVVTVVDQVTGESKSEVVKVGPCWETTDSCIPDGTAPVRVEVLYWNSDAGWTPIEHQTIQLAGAVNIYEGESGHDGWIQFNVGQSDWSKDSSLLYIRDNRDNPIPWTSITYEWNEKSLYGFWECALSTGKVFLRYDAPTTITTTVTVTTSTPLWGPDAPLVEENSGFETIGKITIDGISAPIVEVPGTETSGWSEAGSRSDLNLIGAHSTDYNGTGRYGWFFFGLETGDRVTILLDGVTMVYTVSFSETVDRGPNWAKRLGNIPTSEQMTLFTCEGDSAFRVVHLTAVN